MNRPVSKSTEAMTCEQEMFKERRMASITQFDRFIFTVKVKNPNHNVFQLLCRLACELSSDRRSTVGGVSVRYSLISSMKYLFLKFFV